MAQRAGIRVLVRSFSGRDRYTGPAGAAVASKIAFDTSALGSSNPVAQFGSVTAEVKVNKLDIQGTGQNFAIDGTGQFQALTNFGVSLSLGTDPASLQWPSWIPIQVTQLKDDLKKQFYAEEIDCTAYLTGKRFLESLEGSVNRLQQPGASRFLSGQYAARGRTVQELVRNMARQGLRFAPASPGNEPHVLLAAHGLADSGGAWVLRHCVPRLVR